MVAEDLVFRPADGVVAVHREREVGVVEQGSETVWNSCDQACALEHNAGDINNAAISEHLAKRMRRAERFCVDLQVSEAEKRQIRAVRFGPVTETGVKPKKSSNLKPLSKVEEALKRQARAARFGTKAVGGVNSMHEAKRRARAARFGLSEKPHTSL